MTIQAVTLPLAAAADGATDVPYRPERDTLFDPKRAVMPAAGELGHAGKSIIRQSQRRRRALILAAIRKLLIEEGYKGVTVRRIAELSGYVVQTVYNLVGPRDQAIVEAIADYTLHIGRLAPPNLEDPAAMIRTIEWQAQSVMVAPDFTRQVCLIYFTEGRHIFYQYRQRQIRNTHSILAKQKRNGVLRRDVNCRDLAENLMIYSSAMFTEWADSPFPVEDLIPRLKSGYAHILAGAISPKFGGFAVMPL